MAELRRDKWGGMVLSANGVWRVLRRHGLSTRAARLALVAGYAAATELPRPQPEPKRHLEVDHPGELVQFDCFCIGRLSGTKATVWQNTATDVSRPTPGPSCTPRPATPWPATPPSWPGGWLGTWLSGDGGWRR